MSRINCERSFGLNGFAKRCSPATPAGSSRQSDVPHPDSSTIPDIITIGMFGRAERAARMTSLPSMSARLRSIRAAAKSSRTIASIASRPSVKAVTAYPSRTSRCRMTQQTPTSSSTTRMFVMRPSGQTWNRVRFSGFGQQSLTDLNRAIYRLEQIEEVERLLQRRRRPELDRHAEKIRSALLPVGEGVAGDRNERHRGIDLDQLTDRRDAIHPGHEHVDHDGIKRYAADQPDTGRSIGGKEHAEPLLLQHRFQRSARGIIIINNKNGRHGPPQCQMD